MNPGFSWTSPIIGNAFKYRWTRSCIEYFLCFSFMFSLLAVTLKPPWFCVTSLFCRDLILFTRLKSTSDVNLLDDLVEVIFCFVLGFMSVQTVRSGHISAQKRVSRQSLRRWYWKSIVYIMKKCGPCMGKLKMRWSLAQTTGFQFSHNIYRVVTVVFLYGAFEHVTSVSSTLNTVPLLHFKVQVNPGNERLYFRFSSIFLVSSPLWIGDVYVWVCFCSCKTGYWL